MPRTARKKNIYSIYHVMCRSITEIDLFKDNEDKNKYLSLLKEYKTIFQFKLYSYCLMDNHCHIIIDTNGSDISKIFHGINQKYAHYFNRRYNRHGHLFQDRFKSKIIYEDRYLITLSAYIHANPVSISKYKNHPEKYRYSSLGIYLSTIKDEFDLINPEFIMSHFSDKSHNAKKIYSEFVQYYTNKEIEEDIEFEEQETTYISERKILAREYSVENIIDFLVNKLEIKENILRMKNNRKSTEYRAVFVTLMRCFCNYKHKEICNVIGNITQSRVSLLCSKGAQIINEERRYKNILDEFIVRKSA